MLVDNAAHKTRISVKATPRAGSIKSTDIRNCYTGGASSITKYSGGASRVKNTRC